MTFNIFAIPGLEDLQLDQARIGYLRILQNTNQVAKNEVFTNADIGCIFDHQSKDILAKWDNATKSASLNLMLVKIYPSWTVWDEATNLPIKVTYDKQTWDDGSRCDPSDFLRIGNNNALAVQADNFVVITQDNFTAFKAGTAELKPRILAISKTDNRETTAACEKLKLTIIKIMQQIHSETGTNPNLWDVPFKLTTAYITNVKTKKGEIVSYFHISSVTPIPDEKTNRPFKTLTPAYTKGVAELYESEVRNMNKPLTCYQPQISAPSAVVSSDMVSANLARVDSPPPPPAFLETSIVVDVNSEY